LLQAAKLSDETIIVVNDRLENLVGLECDIVTSRAFADLNKIFDLSQNIKIKDKYLLHKGKKYQEEIFEAKKHWLFDSKVHDSITSESGKILEITNVTHIS
jgi:16S rRNA (guanine527-N7)-methyltransferase